VLPSQRVHRRDRCGLGDRLGYSIRDESIRDWVEPILGSMEMRHIRPRHVRHMLEEAGESMAPASVAQIRSVMSSMMRAALEAELVDANVIAGVRRPKIERPNLSVPTSKQLADLIEEATGSVWAVPIVLASTSAPSRFRRSRSSVFGGRSGTRQRGDYESARRGATLTSCAIVAMERRFIRMPSARRPRGSSCRQVWTRELDFTIYDTVLPQ
jgi:hypothetical protein